MPSKDQIEEARKLNKEHMPHEGQDRLDDWRSIKILIDRGIMAYREIDGNVMNLILALGSDVEKEDLDVIRDVLYHNMDRMLNISEIVGKYEAKYNKKLAEMKEAHDKIVGPSQEEAGEGVVMRIIPDGVEKNESGGMYV